MTGTAGRGRRIGRSLLPPRLRIGLVVALYASTAWALLAVLGRSALGGVLTALPAVPLGILGTVAVLLRRRAEALADQWLADPPDAAGDEP